MAARATAAAEPGRGSPARSSVSPNFWKNVVMAVTMVMSANERIDSSHCMYVGLSMEDRTSLRRLRYSGPFPSASKRTMPNIRVPSPPNMAGNSCKTPPSSLARSSVVMVLSRSAAENANFSSSISSEYSSCASSSRLHASKSVSQKCVKHTALSSDSHHSCKVAMASLERKIQSRTNAGSMLSSSRVSRVPCAGV